MIPTLDATPSSSRTSTDFLTLVAAQERRVLELREELAKADAELTSLKKQWAVHEANKKRDEARQVRRMPVPLDEVPSPPRMDQQGVDEERRRRKALVEMTNHNSIQSSQETGKLGGKGSKRVFEGRHTRTLSLLSPTTKTPNATTIDQLMARDENRSSEDSTTDGASSTPSLSRTPTLDTKVSPNNLPLNLNKTSRPPATHRRSLPPNTADLFIQQSKQVVDGVREGLWTFFEDIRQATVGDEAVNGTVVAQRNARQDSARKARRKRRESREKGREKAGAGRGRPVYKDDSFWREFGLETPKKGMSEESGMENAVMCVQQKGRADKGSLPSLVDDTPTQTTPTEEKEEDWDSWESPVATSTKKQAVAEGVKLGSDGLPWPELKKLTPSKLNRTASDLMRQWGNADELVRKEELGVR